MKEKELRACSVCSVCGHKIGASGIPMFWRVRIERHGLMRDAIQRQSGLAIMLGGNGALAAAMRPDEEMTTPMMEPVEITVCEICCTRPVCIAQLAQMCTADSACASEKEGGQ